MSPELRKLLKVYIAIPIVFAIFIAIVAVCFLFRLNDTKKQGNALADTLYPMVMEHDFDGMVPYFCGKNGEAVTASQIAEYIESMDGWKMISSLTSESGDVNVSVSCDDDYLEIELYHVNEAHEVYQMQFYGKKVDKKWKIVLGR